MNDLKSIIDTIMELYKINFNVFGYNLNLLTVFIGTSLIAMAVYAIRKLFF